MFNSVKKTAVLGLSFILSLSMLTGCASQDKSAAKEATTAFMDAVKANDTNGINSYSNSEVSSGSFVALFDKNYLKEELTSKLGDPVLDDTTLAKLDELGSKYDNLMEEYQITDVTMNDDGTATSYITMTTKFPFDIVINEDAQKKFSEATDSYNETSKEELQQISEEQGQDAAISKAYNDIILIAVDIYEEAIDNSESITYLIALNLAKNEETGTWYVTSVQSYDSYIAGTGAPAKDTDTTAIDGSSSIFESIGGESTGDN